MINVMRAFKEIKEDEILVEKEERKVINLDHSMHQATKQFHDIDVAVKVFDLIEEYSNQVPQEVLSNVIDDLEEEESENSSFLTPATLPPLTIEPADSLEVVTEMVANDVTEDSTESQRDRTKESSVMVVEEEEEKEKECVVMGKIEKENDEQISSSSDGTFTTSNYEEDEEVEKHFLNERRKRRRKKENSISRSKNKKKMCITEKSNDSIAAYKILKKRDFQKRILKAKEKEKKVLKKGENIIMDNRKEDVAAQRANLLSKMNPHFIYDSYIDEFNDVTLNEVKQNKKKKKKKKEKNYD
jgi:hypothetical protein